MRLFLRYLFLCGVVAHLLGIAVFVHYRSTGASLHEYVSKGVTRLDRDSSPARHIARFTRLLLLDSGLLSDPRNRQLPPFPGPESWPMHATRADGFQRLVIDTNGIPQQSAAGPFLPTVTDAVVRVHDEKTLAAALRNASAGDIITLSPGDYRFSQHRIGLRGAGTPDRPIVVRAEAIGQVRIALDTVEGFYVDQPYWLFENLEIRGRCEHDSRCEHAFHVVGDARGITLRNNRLIDFNAPLKVNGLFGKRGARFPEFGLVHNNAVFNTRVRKTGNPVTLLNINGGNGWVVAANFLADFAKGSSDRISYGAFMKANSQGGVFERNLVVCHWRLPLDPGVRVGLSFGGGGSAANISRAGSNTVEHTGGVMRNNIIARCPLDVGIYLNRSARTRIHNNLLLDTRGIDVRFPTSSAELDDNVLDGRARTRDGGSLHARHNLIADECGWLDKTLGSCGTDDWYVDAVRGDLRLADWALFYQDREAATRGRDDFCGAQRPAISSIGPIEYDQPGICIPELP